MQKIDRKTLLGIRDQLASHGWEDAEIDELVDPKLGIITGFQELLEQLEQLRGFVEQEYHFKTFHVRFNPASPPPLVHQSPVTSEETVSRSVMAERDDAVAKADAWRRARHAEAAGSEAEW